MDWRSILCYHLLHWEQYGIRRLLRKLTKCVLNVTCVHRMSLTEPPVSGVRSGTFQPRGVTLGDPGEITATQPAAMEGELSGP